MGSARIEAIGLSKSFAASSLFTDLSFSRDRGVLAVTGANGSGKTTLLKILAGLIRPGSGTVRVERDGRALEPEARRAAIGWAGPDLSFYPELTAAENLAFFRRAAGFSSDSGDIERRVDSVGLGGAHGSVDHFSTGMRQRLRIAFARLLDPEILLLDEPFAGLDADGRERVARFVASAGVSGPVIVAGTDEAELPRADEVLRLPR